MSMDAGGLAQMTYNNSLNGGLGMPTSGFASRARASNTKRLSVATAHKITTIDENQPAPRTSRSHMLAGLRTQPKSPSVPASAPPDQLQHPGLGESRFARLEENTPRRNSPPKTATSARFPVGGQQQYGSTGMNNIYSPGQILAPPSISMNDDDAAQMDPAIYAELVRTNQYLAEQQMRLQQQLINVTAAAQQFQHMNLGQAQQSFGAASPGGGISLYEQQLQFGLQPIIEQVPNQPGLYSVYNPMTKQTSYYQDPNYQGPQQQPQQHVQAPSTYGHHELSHSPPPATPTFRAQVSPPPPEGPAPSSVSNNWRSTTPPKATPSPPRDEPAPLPQPASFRHRKGLSLVNTSMAGFNSTDAGPRTSGLRTAGLPPTPMTGTFGPGQAREGEHPIRQPRGPPSLEELTAKPTAKHEGSKNFASRQRRRALHSLVRAGLERRGGGPRPSGSMDSADGSSSRPSGTPTSERDSAFATASPVRADSEGTRSGSASLSGQPSLGNLRGAAAIGAIGSERAGIKERSRERGSADSYASATAAEAPAPQAEEGARRSNLLLLASAEKRRSQIF